MYDPVNAVDHIRFIFTNPEAVKQLTVKDFVPSMLLRKLYDIDNNSYIYICSVKPQKCK
jgi:hypothetical protein